MKIKLLNGYVAVLIGPTGEPVGVFKSSDDAKSTLEGVVADYFGTLNAKLFQFDDYEQGVIYNHRYHDWKGWRSRYVFRLYNEQMTDQDDFITLYLMFTKSK